MSIDALVSGRIHKTPQRRISQNGKPFATAIVRAAARDGTGLFVSVITFSDSAIAALMALEDGDAVAIAGELTPKIFTPRDGGEPRPSLDLVGHRVMSEYNVQRKRKAVAEAQSPRTDERAADSVTPPSGADAGREFDDAIPF